MRKSRIVVSLAAAAIALAACTGGAAETEAPWPNQPILFVAPGTVGGGSDTQARLAAAAIEAAQLIDQPIAVLNKAPQEAYSFVIGKKDNPYYLFTNANQLLTYPMTGQQTYDAFTDFIPVANLVFDPAVMVTRPDSPFKSFDDVISAAKASPNTITIGGGQIGTQDHMSLLTLQNAAGFQLNFVPFQGGAEIHRNVLGGQVDLAIGNPSDFIASLESGDLVGLVITDAVRNEAPTLKDIPTAMELGVNASFGVWRGWFFPAGIDDATVNAASALFEKVLADDNFKENYVTRFGVRPNYMNPADFKAFLQEQEKIYEQLLKEAGVIQ